VVLENGDKIFTQNVGTSQTTINPDGTKNSTYTGMTRYTGGTGEAASDARRIVAGIAPRFVPRRAEPPLAPQAPAEERSSGRPKRAAGAPDAAVAPEVHAGTPKSQMLANYPREFWQPSTTD